MPVKKAHIIGIVVAVVIGTACYYGYRYFVQSRFRQYKLDAERLEELETKYKQIEKEFGGFRPELVVYAYDQQIDPWRVTVEDRAGFFSTGLNDAPAPPEDVEPRFWYEGEIQKRVQELQQFAASRQIYLPDVTFGAPLPQDLRSQLVTGMQATLWLWRFELGNALTRKLVNSGVLRLDQIEMWDPVTRGILKRQPFGVRFWITLENLVKLMNDLNQGDLVAVEEGTRYYDVEGIRVRNTQLRNPVPALEVEMVVAMADFYREGTPIGQREGSQSRLDSIRDEGEEGFDRMGRMQRSRWRRWLRYFLPI